MHFFIKKKKQNKTHKNSTNTPNNNYIPDNNILDNNQYLPSAPLEDYQINNQPLVGIPINNYLEDHCVIPPLLPPPLLPPLPVLPPLLLDDLETVEHKDLLDLPESVDKQEM